VKILSLKSRNVKRLRAVEITPDGNVVIIGGRNGQGKSSVLDSIAYALGGKDVICREPVRRGEQGAEVTCDLGEFVVRRTFTADGGGQLVVETKDGARFSSPQARLNDVIGRLSFDPLEFARMDGGRQAETLRTLVGLDFAAIDRERESTFAARTDVNREGKALKARLDGMPALHAGAPEAEVPSAEILTDLEVAQGINAENAAAWARAAGARNALGIASTELERARGICERTRQEIAALQNRLIAEEGEQARITASMTTAQAESDRLANEAAGLTDLDLVPIKTRLANLEGLNRQVRENRQHREVALQLEQKRIESKELTDRIDALDASKQAAITSAKFPVDGLGFDAQGIVTFGGLPFDQASAAEQLRVSVAIGLALNPKLRILLIRDGSLLDEDSLRELSEMADREGAQLWIERVEDGGATVIIEDGSVVPAEVSS
jgi:energy-coupling factor transporter ATP-binding protein EcfA2